MFPQEKKETMDSVQIDKNQGDPLKILTTDRRRKIKKTKKGNAYTNPSIWEQL